MRCTSTMAWSRFIPARAGNTSAICVRLLPASVHPRSRGEHRLAPRRSAPRSGSSPLARGTQHHGIDMILFPRFIPARAGNTEYTCITVSMQSVHPRSRGEHAGSGIQGMVVNRFIPARAGNTYVSGKIHGTMTVHPRSRGEHLPPAPLYSIFPGSSPLARGTHFPQTNVIKELLRYRYFYRPERPLRLHYWRAIRA